MWELDQIEGWAPKYWCLWPLVLEKTLESPLDCKEIQPVHPKGNQPWIFFGRTDAEAPLLWPPDVKSQLIGKDSDAEKDWGQEKKETTEDEMAGWTWVWTSSERWWWTGKPGCSSPWGHKELDMTEQLNNNNQQTPYTKITLNELKT